MTRLGFAVTALLGAVSALPAADLVTSLWQMPDLSFGLYSGYLPISGSDKQLHYLTALSQNDYTKDPVIVWFNGGPGCSSLLGFLQEHGPYTIKDGETNFTKNDYSWNKQATVIYIESPAGVGYSLCPNKSQCQFDDFNSSADNLQALEYLFINKFPELQTNKLYISGESYAGIYVPRLVQQLDWLIGNCTANKSCSWVPNLTGFIVGNGVTDYRYDNGLALLEMVFWYGFVSTDDYMNVKTYCTGDNPAPNCA